MHSLVHMLSTKPHVTYKAYVTSCLPISLTTIQSTPTRTSNMEPPSSVVDTQATALANPNTPEVDMAENAGPDAYSYNGAMQHNENGYAEADMLDADEQYGSDDQLEQAPYYSNRNRSLLDPRLTTDPRLASLLDDGMANIDLQNGSDDPSAGQEYAGDVSSEDRTPVKPKTKRSKSGKKKQTAEVEEPEPVVSSEADDPANEEDDRDDDFLPEPVVPKKTKRKTVTPKKIPKGKGKAPVKPRKSARKSATKVQEELPFHRQRRAPKHGISESRPIPRSYEECDEADKTLIDMRDKENKIWKDIRVVWEEMTGQKTGNSTLPNRYE